VISIGRKEVSTHCFASNCWKYCRTPHSRLHRGAGR